jgi:hypothetical protein
VWLVAKRLLPAIWLLLVAPTHAGCWYFLGDPMAYAVVGAFVPDQPREEVLQAVDAVMREAGFRRAKHYTAGYLIDGRVMSYSDYEQETCEIKTDEDRRRCMRTFMYVGVPQHTDEFRTDEEIKVTFVLPDGRAGIEAKIARRKRDSTVCVEFTAFPATEFDADVQAGIGRLREAFLDRFGENNVPCYRGRDAPY